MSQPIVTLVGRRPNPKTGKPLTTTAAIEAGKLDPAADWPPGHAHAPPDKGPELSAYRPPL